MERNWLESLIFHPKNVVWKPERICIYNCTCHFRPVHPSLYEWMSLHENMWYWKKFIYMEICTRLSQEMHISKEVSSYSLLKSAHFLFFSTRKPLPFDLYNQTMQVNTKWNSKPEHHKSLWGQSESMIILYPLTTLQQNLH